MVDLFLFQHGAIRFFAVFFLTDGIGWLLAGQHADEKKRFRVVGYCAVISALLFIGDGLIPSNIPVMQEGLLGIAVAFSLTALLRYFVWENDWKPIRVVMKRLERTRTLYDTPEVICLSILWFISLSAFGKGIFVGLPALPWDIGGMIAVVRTFDLPAAVGIASHAMVRNIFLWVARLSMAFTVIWRLIVWLNAN